MSERMVAASLLILVGAALTLWAGLDVDNYWGGVGTFLAGMGIGKMD